MEEEAEETNTSFSINDNRDILLEILKRLDGQSLAVAACVCRLWCAVAQQEPLWEALCNRHTDTAAGARPVVLAMGGYRRLYVICVRPVLDRLSRGRRTGFGSDRTGSGPVWGKDEAQLSLSLFSIDCYERLGGRVGEASSSLLFLCAR